MNGWGFKNPYPGFDALFGTTYGIPVAGIDTVRTGNKGPLGDGIYNHPEYFDADGVYGVVTDGGFYINDFQLPASAEELALLKSLAQLPEEVRLAARDYDPSRINRYLIDLAAAFHKFYNACRIKGEEEHVLRARLKLADTVRSVLRNGMELIGSSAPEKM